MLLMAAALLATIAAAERHITGEPVPEWLLLALIFLFLSLDETVQLHELTIAPLRERIEATGLLYFAWILPAGICVGLFVVAYLRFLGRLPGRTRRLFLCAGAVSAAGRRRCTASTIRSTT
jgi:hypothetical protein